MRKVYTGILAFVTAFAWYNAFQLLAKPLPQSQDFLAPASQSLLVKGRVLGASTTNSEQTLSTSGNTEEAFANTSQFCNTNPPNPSGSSGPFCPQEFASNLSVTPYTSVDKSVTVTATDEGDYYDNGYSGNQYCTFGSQPLQEYFYTSYASGDPLSKTATLTSSNGQSFSSPINVTTQPSAGYCYLTQPGGESIQHQVEPANYETSSNLVGGVQGMGSASWTVNTSSWANGTYTLSVQIGASTLSVPITVQHPATVTTNPTPTPAPTPVAASGTASTPTITGPTGIAVSSLTQYTFVSTDYYAGSGTSLGTYGGTINYSVNWGDGSTSQTSSGLTSGTGYAVAHSWAKAGSYTVSVTATPAIGKASQNSETVTVTSGTTTPPSGSAVNAITTPVSNSTYAAGQSITVNWTGFGSSATGTPSPSTLILMLFQSSTSGTIGYPTTVAASVTVPNTGSYTTTLPTTLQAGNYVVATPINNGPATGSVAEVSTSGIFAITNSSTTPPVCPAYGCGGPEPTPTPTPTPSPTPTPTPITSSQSVSTPSITTPSSVQAGSPAQFAFVASDYYSSTTATTSTYGGAITYNINWGDASTNSVSSGLASGTSYITSHTWTTPGTYTISVVATPAVGNPNSNAVTVTVSNAAANQNTNPNTTTPANTNPNTTNTGTDAVGTNIITNGGMVYMIASDGTKRPYTSAGGFLSYGFNNWSDVVQASTADLALPTGSYIPPMNGSLINDKGTVYIIVDGERQGFASASVFTGLGYNWQNVIPADTSFMTTLPPITSSAIAHPAGTVVNQNGTAYLITDSGKLAFSSIDIFDSWGYNFREVVPANSYDTNLAQVGYAAASQPGQLNPTAGTSSTSSASQ